MRPPGGAAGSVVHGLRTRRTPERQRREERMKCFLLDWTDRTRGFLSPVSRCRDATTPHSTATLAKHWELARERWQMPRCVQGGRPGGLAPAQSITDWD